MCIVDMDKAMPKMLETQTLEGIQKTAAMGLAFEGKKERAEPSFLVQMLIWTVYAKMSTIVLLQVVKT